MKSFIMKTKILLLTSLISIGLLTGASAFARGGGGGGGQGGGAGVPARSGSGSTTTYRGNPNSQGTPVQDGSGKTTAPGKGAKDGTGTNANCPNK